MSSFRRSWGTREALIRRAPVAGASDGAARQATGLALAGRCGAAATAFASLAERTGEVRWLHAAALAWQRDGEHGPAVEAFDAVLQEPSSRPHRAELRAARALSLLLLGHEPGPGEEATAPTPDGPPRPGAGTAWARLTSGRWQ